MRILIADDDLMCCEALSIALEADGHEYAVVHDGQAAIERLNAESFHVLITDWEMPRLAGPDLCRRVRAAGFERYLYTIMLTSRGDHASLVEGLSAGADDFLVKPFDPQELSIRLRGAERLLALETRDLTIFALAKLAEARDPETGTHLERVRLYCKIVAQHLSKQPAFAGVVDEEFIRLIYNTSPLHDIGKVGIPDSVLLKAGRLDDAEFAIMKTHAELGAKTLDAALAIFPNAKFLQMARDIAACHHEQYSGGGYPKKLAGEQIPLSARIVALADVYDALRSKRVYKEGFEHHAARTIIIDGSGTHFDPAIVEAFVACEADFIRIANEHSEPRGERQASKQSGENGSTSVQSRRAA